MTNFEKITHDPEILAKEIAEIEQEVESETIDAIRYRVERELKDRISGDAFEQICEVLNRTEENMSKDETERTGFVLCWLLEDEEE